MALLIVDRAILIITENSIPLVEYDFQIRIWLQRNIFNCLASHPYNDHQNAVSEGTFEQMLALADYLAEPTLTALVKFLGDSIVTERLDCSTFLNLNNEIIEKGVHQFTIVARKSYYQILRVLLILLFLSNAKIGNTKFRKSRKNLRWEIVSLS